MIDWIWKLCNMAFESGVVPEEWRYVVDVSSYKNKGERTECKNYRGISLLNVIRKVCARILNRVRRATEDLIDNERGRSQIREGDCRSDLRSKTEM